MQFRASVPIPNINTQHTQSSYLPPTKEEVHVFARVCLSVSVSVSKITHNACMDLDETLRVDVATWTNRLTFEPDPIKYKR